MSDKDPNELADQREAEAAALERHGEELDQQVKDVREDWNRKREDAGVPGAVPEESDGDGAEESPGDGAEGSRGDGAEESGGDGEEESPAAEPPPEHAS